MSSFETVDGVHSSPEVLDRSDPNNGNVGGCCCLPSGVKLCQSEIAGRYLTASRGYHAGDVIFQNAPTAYVLNTCRWSERCLHCFQAPQPHQGDKKLSRCNSCKRASYCSKACQQKDWPNHKMECKQLALLWNDDRNDVPLEVLDEVLLLLRSYRAETGATSAACCLQVNNETLEYSDLARETINCGRDHCHDLYCPDVSTEEDTLVNYIAGLVLQCLSNSSAKGVVIPTMPALKRRIHQFHHNNFGIQDDLQCCIGMGVYPATALLNHSCVPSCILRYVNEQETSGESAQRGEQTAFSTTNSMSFSYQ